MSNLTKAVIKPIFPSKLSIHSQQTFQIIQKRSYKGCSKFVIRRSLSDTPDEKGRKLRLAIKLIKLLKPLKLIRKLNLKHFFLKGWELNFSKMLYLAKRFSQTPCLDLVDYRRPGSHQRGLFVCWPKFMKRLVKLSYALEEPRAVHWSENLQAGPELPFKRAEPITKFARCQRKLKALSLQFPNMRRGGEEDDLAEYWDFEKYPKSLEKLELQQLNSDSHEVSPSSLTKLQKLKDLRMNFGYCFGLGVFVPFLDLISDASELESLSISGLDFTSVEPQFVCDIPEYLPGLTRLEFGEDVYRDPGHDDSFPLEFSSAKDLKHLILRVHICSVEKFFAITDLLAEMESLVALTLHVHFHILPKDSTITNILLERVSRLPLLQYVSIFTSFGGFSYPEKPIKISSMPLTRLFTNGIPLKEITITLGQHETSSECISSLFEGLALIAPGLVKVTINIGGYNLANRGEIEKVEKFFERLENIQTLNLRSLNIQSLVFFSKAVEIISSLKFLKYFSVGRIAQTAMDSSIAEKIERLLSKNGLKEFYCRVPKSARFSFAEYFTKLIKVKDVEDLEAQNLGLIEFKIFIPKYKHTNW